MKGRGEVGEGSELSDMVPEERRSGKSVLRGSRPRSYEGGEGRLPKHPGNPGGPLQGPRSRVLDTTKLRWGCRPVSELYL